MSDDRKVRINFSAQEKKTQVVESFEAENTNSIEMQLGVWQDILYNFNKYTEANQ